MLQVLKGYAAADSILLVTDDATDRIRSALAWSSIQMHYYANRCNLDLNIVSECKIYYKANSNCCNLDLDIVSEYEIYYEANGCNLDLNVVSHIS